MENSPKYKIFKSLSFLPAWNFFAARETGDLRYLYKLEHYDDLEGIENHPDLLDVWPKLFDEYIDRFSFSKEHQEIMEIRKEIIIAEAEYAISENRYDLNRIKRLEKDLENLLEPDNEGKSLNFEEQVLLIEGWRGVPIDSNKITCIRFFTLREQFREEAYKSQVNSLMAAHGS